jgi:hypothetical protein
MGASPKNCGLLGGNGNTLKLKTTAKLKDKRTSIATVRGLDRMYATFSTPLVLITDYRTLKGFPFLLSPRHTVKHVLDK